MILLPFVDICFRGSNQHGLLYLPSFVSELLHFWHVWREILEGILDLLNEVTCWFPMNPTRVNRNFDDWYRVWFSFFDKLLSRKHLSDYNHLRVFPYSNFGCYVPLHHQEWAHKQYIAKHQQGPSQQWGNFYYFRMQNIRFALFCNIVLLYEVIELCEL